VSEQQSVSAVIREILDGQGLALAQAARHLPSSRLGRPVSPSTVWRWCREGLQLPDGRRLYLEHARIRGRWMTSAPALARWIAAQSDPPAEAMPTLRTPTQRAKAADRAGRELDAAGL
jgi:hypothetical protein